VKERASRPSRPTKDLLRRLEEVCAAPPRRRTASSFEALALWTLPSARVASGTGADPR